MPVEATVEVLGVHPVSGVESCHLIEVRIDGSEEAPDFALFTQQMRDRPSSDWQVPYDERLLDDEGERVVAGLSVNRAKDWPDPARVAFFFHFLDISRPLATPFGDVTLPPPTDKPTRLSFLAYEAP